MLCFTVVLAPQNGPKVRKVRKSALFRLFRTFGPPGLPEYQLFLRETLIFWPGAPGERLLAQNDMKSHTSLPICYFRPRRPHDDGRTDGRTTRAGRGLTPYARARLKVVPWGRSRCASPKPPHSNFVQGIILRYVMCVPGFRQI